MVTSCVWLQYEHVLLQLKRAESWNGEFFILSLQKKNDLNKNILIIFILTRTLEAPYATCFHSTTERVWFWNFTKPLKDLLELTDLNNNQSFLSSLLISNPLRSFVFGGFCCLFFFLTASLVTQNLTSLCESTRLTHLLTASSAFTKVLTPSEISGQQLCARLLQP